MWRFCAEYGRRHVYICNRVTSERFGGGEDGRKRVQSHVFAFHLHPSPMSSLFRSVLPTTGDNQLRAQRLKWVNILAFEMRADNHDDDDDVSAGGHTMPCTFIASIVMLVCNARYIHT